MKMQESPSRNYNKTWKKIEKLMRIDFESKTVYEYIKT